MKYLKQNGGKRFGWMFGLTLAVAVLGLLLAIQGFFQFHSIYYRDHDKRLSDIVASVDHSIDQNLHHCFSALDQVLSRRLVTNAETEFLQSGDCSRLKTALDSSLLISEELIDRVLLLDGEQVLFSTAMEEDRDYSFIGAADNASVMLCTDDAGNIYLVLTAPSAAGELTYAALVSLRDFYEVSVADDIFDGYWTVLYLENGDLFLRNNDDDLGYCIYTPEEAAAREDGYSILLKSQQQQEDVAEDYVYPKNGVPTASRLFARCSAHSDNGIFAIGVALSEGTVYAQLQSNTFLQVGALLLLLLGIGFFVLLLINNRKDRRRAESRISILEQENELHSRLLEQQKELAHHQRIEMIGTMTAGIAHEFNNLLTPIMGYSTMILDAHADDGEGETYDDALEIYRASVRAKKLVNRISRLSGKNSPLGLTQVNVAELLRNTVKLASSAQPNNVEVKCAPAEGLTLYGSESQLEQMLLNLIINAFQAMEAQGGILTLESRREDNELLISVSDTGPGIPPDLQERIYQPFFTTKDPGKGTGLGLSIVYQCAVDHNAAVTLRSCPGSTTFTLHFPIGGQG